MSASPGRPDLHALLRTGLHAHRAGDLRRAEAHYRQVLDADPDNPDALNLLGVVGLQTDHPREAAELFRKALSRDPGNPEIHFHLGIAAVTQGDLENGRQSLAEAVRREPDYAAALMHLGTVCVELDRGDEGVGYLRRAAELDANDASIRQRLAVALIRLDRLGEAEAALGSIPEPAARAGEVRLAFGRLRERQGRREDAIACFREVLALDPDHAEAHLALGEQLHARGRLGEAERHARRARELAPDLPAPRIRLGLILQADGRADEAVESFRSAGQTGLVYLAEMYLERGAFDRVRQVMDELCALNPEHPHLYYLASQIDDFRFLEAHRAHAESYVRAGKGDRFNISDVHLALGRSYEAEGDIATAFDHFRRANDLIAAVRPYDREAEERWVDSVIGTFTSALFERLGGIGADSDVPVFVVGMPRSGTSLIEQIVASHPDGAGAGELREMARIQLGLCDALGTDRPFPACVEELDGGTARELANRYLGRLNEAAPDAARIVDKMPANFRHLGLIALLLPKARIVHCLRDPLDTCLSIFQRRFTGDHPYSHSLAALGHYYRLYGWLMDHWRKVLPMPMHEVRYETLVNEPEEQIRTLIGYLGLAWDDRCLSFHETDRAVRTASAWQVRQPLYRTAVARWRKYDAWLDELKDALAGR